MAYTDNFPQRPIFTLDAANAGRLDPRMTFSRSDTPPTYAAPSAVHYWSNEKHESSQNLVAYSSDISNSYWTKDGVTPTGGQTAPDGGTDAYKLTESSVNNEHRIYHTFGVTPTDETTITFYAKYIGRQWIYVRAKDVGGTNRYCWFDIQNGVVGTQQTNVTASIAASGNGYYKCTVVLASAIASGQSLNIGGAAADGDGAAYTGSGADAFALWGINMSTLGETVLNETSGQIHRSYAPTLKSVTTAGQPRFEYDPATDGQSMGILIEGQSTNLLNYSEQFDNGYWYKDRTTVTANSAIAPNGELAADLITANQTGASNTHNLSKSGYAFTSGTTYTYSVFVKAAGFSSVDIGGGNPATYPALATFTLTGAGTASSTHGSSSIQSCGNGWYRCVVTGTAAASAATNLNVTLRDSSGTSFDGDDYSGVLLWGAMMEQASHSSSYLKVEGSTATRALESLSMTDSGLFDNGGGTIVAEYDTSSPSAVAGIAAITDGAGSSNAVSLRLQAATAKLFVNNSGSTQAATSTTAPSAGVYQKIAGRYAVDDFGVCVNGGSVVSDGNGSVPVINKLEVGTMDNGSYHLNGHVKRVALYNEALSDTNLQALTS